MHANAKGEHFMPSYCVNPKTRTLHIKGYCHLSSPAPAEWDEFKTEESANIEYEGNLKHCKLCWKKRDAR